MRFQQATFGAIRHSQTNSRFQIAYVAGAAYNTLGDKGFKIGHAIEHSPVEFNVVGSVSDNAHAFERALRQPQMIGRFRLPK
jgi:hypothetical protein